MTVTFFGHRDTPRESEEDLRNVLIDLIENFDDKVDLKKYVL